MEESDPRMAERIQLTRRSFAQLGSAAAVAWGASPLAAADAGADRLLYEATLKLEYLTPLDRAGILDKGKAGVVELPPEETQRRWDLTTPQWPIMHAVLYGVTRDQFMAKHKANHINVAYAASAKDADAAMLAKAAMARAMGMDVSICGTRKAGKPW